MELELFTTFGSTWQDHFHQTAAFRRDPGVENQAVNLYPDAAFRTMEGFGGAVTDSAAYVYSLMDEDQKRELMRSYFSPEEMNYGLVRVHMDSCDFSLEQYEAMSDPSDAEMRSFSFAQTEKYILPMLRDAQAAAGRPLELMLSPWSPPAFMKTNGERVRGGGLKPEYRQFWAEYMCRYIQEFQRRGFLVRRITLQNEPHAVQTWDSCVFTAREQREFLVEFMRPALLRHGLGDVEVFLWDHNKERAYEWMREAAEGEAAEMVAGLAFHWYSGDHFESLDLLQHQYPDKRLILSESCIEFSKFAGESGTASALRLSHEIIGDLNHGMTAFYDWNLLLDEEGGPNHVGNYCLAPYLFDTRRKKLLPQLLQQHLAHFSHYLTPGSQRIGHSRYTEQIDVTAWKRPDGSIAVVMLNKSEQIMPVCLRMDGQIAECLLYPQSITTGVIQ